MVPVQCEVTSTASNVSASVRTKSAWPFRPSLGLPSTYPSELRRLTSLCATPPREALFGGYHFSHHRCPWLGHKVPCQLSLTEFADPFSFSPRTPTSGVISYTGQPISNSVAESSSLKDEPSFPYHYSLDLLLIMISFTQSPQKLSPISYFNPASHSLSITCLGARVDPPLILEVDIVGPEHIISGLWATRQTMGTPHPVSPLNPP